MTTPIGSLLSLPTTDRHQVPRLAVGIVIPGFEKEKEMKKKDSQITAGLASNRRSFLKKGVAAAGAATMGVGLLNSPARAFAHGDDGSSGQINRGDAAILGFLPALETIEADLWRQYAELGGAVNQPGASPIDLPFPTGLAGTYITALQQLDG